MFTADEKASVTAPLPSAKTLPAKAYTHSQVFDVELREVFYKEWICVARQKQLPEPGDYRLVDVVEQPLILVRTEDRSLHAMSAICPHRAMQVVDEHGSAAHFSCPYHRWKFDLTGNLLSAPHMDGVSNFPAAECALRTVKVDVWEGFIFVNLDADSAPLKTRLAQLGAIVGGYRMGDMVVASSIEFDCPWNWKILLENFMEAYHHIGPHRTSVQPTHNAKDSYVSGSVEQGWSVVHMPEVSDRPVEAGLPHIAGLSNKQATETLASLIMPTFAWLNTPSLAFWYELCPKAYNQMTLVIHTLLPQDIVDGPQGGEIAQLVQASIEQIHIEDIAVNQGPWKGLHAPLTAQGPLSPLEKAIWLMNQWWLQRVIRE